MTLERSQAKENDMLEHLQQAAFSLQQSSSLLHLSDYVYTEPALLCSSLTGDEDE